MKKTLNIIKKIIIYGVALYAGLFLFGLIYGLLRGTFLPQLPDIAPIVQSLQR